MTDSIIEEMQREREERTAQIGFELAPCWRCKSRVFVEHDEFNGEDFIACGSCGISFTGDDLQDWNHDHFSQKH